MSSPRVEEKWVPPAYAGHGERPRLRCGDVVETVDPKMLDHCKRGRVPRGVVVGANNQGSLSEAMLGYHEFTIVVRESPGITHVTDQRSHQLRIIPEHDRTHLDRVQAAIYGWRPPTEFDPGSRAEERFTDLVSDIHDSIMDAVGTPESLREAISSVLMKHAWAFFEDDDTWEWQMLSALCPPLWWNDDFMDWPDINELAIMAANNVDEAEERAAQQYKSRIRELELELSNIRETLKARDRIEAPWP